MKGKRFTRKAWKRFVRILSCLVVFCTTYALILPAITAQATSYCGLEEHTHSDECYAEHLECDLEENEETGHVHSEECYSRELTCGKTPHQHTRICFSNPDADLETAEDWEKTLPTEEELADKTAREKIIAVAQSQLNTKESDDNFEVDSETEVRGITRYGQWDGEPYEEWSGAFARFVLTYAGADEDKDEADKFINAEKDIDEWADSLQENEQLLPIDEGKPGDILYIYDEDDDNRLKAGIITEVKNETIKAIIGNRNKKVDTLQIGFDNNDVRAIYKAIPDEIATNEKNESNINIEEEPNRDVNQSDQATESITDLEDTDLSENEKNDNEFSEENTVAITDDVNEELKREEEKDKNGSLEEDTYDYKKVIDLDDGTKITAEWNEDTFVLAKDENQTSENEVVFQAGPVVLSEQEEQNILKQINDDENQLKSYDLSFYQRNDRTELEKIEPVKPVKVSIVFPSDEVPLANALFHITDSGKIENLTSEMNLVSNEQLSTQDETGITFEANAFSKYIVSHPTQEDTISSNNTNVYAGKKWKLTTDINGWGTRNFSGSGVTEIDLNGNTLKGNGPLFTVSNGHTLIISNGQSGKIAYEPNTSANLGPGYWNPGGSAPHELVYSDGNSKYVPNVADNWGDLIQSKTKVSNISLLKSNSGNTIEVSGSGTVQIENVGIVSWNGQGIKASSGKVDLENTYIINGNRGIYLEGTSTMRMSGGAISDHGVLHDRGAGIYINGTNVNVTLEDGAQVVNNKTYNDRDQQLCGGGISVYGGKLFIHEAYIAANSTDSGDGDGSFATGGGIKAYGGATVYLLNTKSTISGNLAKGSGGGISIEDDNTKLYMYAGNIDGNICAKSEGGGIALQAQRGAPQAFLYAGKIQNNVTLTKENWGGGGIFCGEGAKLVVPNGAYITNNTASVYGGGVAGCSTGKIIMDDSMIVAGNNVDENTYRWTTHDKKYDQGYSEKVGVTKELAHDYFTCFYANVNGKFGNSDAKWTGVVDSKDNKFSNISSGWITSQYCLAMTSGYTGDGQGKSLVITGNESRMHGGGLLINGYLIGGDVEYIFNTDTLNIKGLKAVRNSEGQTGGSPADYDFELWDSQEKELIATGASDSSGYFTIMGVALQSTTGGNGTIKYVLKEGIKSKEGVLNDTTKYEIEVQITTTQLPSYTYTKMEPLKDELGNLMFNADGTPMTKPTEVTVKEFKTTVLNDNVNNIKVYKLPGHDPVNANVSRTNNGTSTHTLMSQYTVNLAPSGATPTFINKRVKTLDLTIKKDWDDLEQDSHLNHKVNLDLYRGYDSTHTNGEKIESITLKSPEWSKTFKNLPAEDSYGSQYFYWVVETSVVDENGEPISGYIVEVGDMQLSQSESTDEKYVTIDAWVPALTLIEGTEYILVNENSDVALGIASSGNVTSANTASLSRLPGTKDDSIAYRYEDQESALYQIMTATNKKSSNSVTKAGLLMQAGTLRLAGEYGSGAGLKWWSEGKVGDKNDLNGFAISNGTSILYKWDSESTQYNNVIFKDGSFGTSFQQSSNATPAKFYTKGTVEILESAQSSTTSYTIKVENKKISNKIQITKTGEEETQKLPGAIFGLYSDAGATKLILQKESDDDGIVEFTDLAEGTYWVREIQAPEGYIKEDKIYKFEFKNTVSNIAKITLPETIKNTLQRFELPETGGPGNNIITASGAALIVLASCMYKSSSKRNRKEGE